MLFCIYAFQYSHFYSLMTSNKDVYPTNNYSQPFTAISIFLFLFIHVIFYTCISIQLYLYSCFNSAAKYSYIRSSFILKADYHELILSSHATIITYF